MGIGIKEIKLLFELKKHRYALGKIVTIGRQNLFLSAKEAQEILASVNIPQEAIDSFLKNDNTYCESFFQLLGAESIDSIDASGYEQATILHDMNQPITETLKGKYDTVIDGGSLEHIFNFPVAIRSCMDLLKPGGFYIGITPANNFFGHGFYQFSPELYFRVFSEENGFNMNTVVLYSEKSDGKWYELNDPRNLGNRSILVNSIPLYLFVAAQKINQVIPFLKCPSQSDYSDRVWNKQLLVEHEIFQTKGLLNSIKKAIPYSVKVKSLGVRKKFKTLFSEVGSLESLHFVKSKKKF